MPVSTRRVALKLATLAALLLPHLGCGTKEIPPEEASQIKVANPTPDNPLKDVTLDNESEFVDQIGGISR